MSIRSIIKTISTNLQLTLVILALVFLELQPGRFRYRPCNCDDLSQQGSELNIELKDFFFKYQNL